MGIKIAPVKLFILDNKEKKFKSDFVCGIKYFENCEYVNFNYIEKNKDNISNWKDYFRMLCLETIFEEDDGIEVLKYKNDIYRIDTTASFSISNFDIYPLAYDFNSNGINIKKFANTNILKKAERKTNTRIEKWKNDMNYFLEKIEYEYFSYYLDTYKLLKEITDKDLEEWTNILTIFYPNIIGDYFKNYFKNLKLDVEQFLINIEKINSR